jgi:aryl-alcohol dehydrogenase-like predicted oxidoreductase
MRGSIPRFAPDALAANQKLIDLIKTVGERHNATPAQVALAWILAQKPWIVPLFGTRKLERFDENIGALNVKLTSDDLHDIKAANVKIEGARYPDEHMKLVGI